MQALARNPQIRVTHTAGNLKFMVKNEGAYYHELKIIGGDVVSEIEDGIPGIAR